MRWLLLLLAGALLQVVGPFEPPSPPPPPRRAPAAAPPPGTLPVFFLAGAWLHPVYRPQGPATPEHVLGLLLAGPTHAERADQIRTALPAGTRLLGLQRRQGTLLVDLSSAGGPAALPQAAAQVAATLSSFADIRAVRVCVQGRPVRAILRAQFLHPTPLGADRTQRAVSPMPRGRVAVAGISRPLPQPPLAGKVIVLNPGHGLTRGNDGRWRYQRPHFGQMVEDQLNVHFAIAAARELRRLGATVHATRPLRLTDEPGISGAPRWQEAAKYYLRDIGLPDWVHQPLATDFEADIDARPLYANYLGADLLISLHNNIGAASGTLALYDLANGHAAESRRLAHLLHDHVVQAIRAEVSAGWNSLGVQGNSARYGENHWAHMPAAILEIGFISRRGDRHHLAKPECHRAVGQAVAAAVAEYFGESAPTWAGAALPERVPPVTAPRPAQPPVVACLGDPAGAPNMPYVAALQALANTREGTPPRVVRVGIQTLEEALRRWNQAVAPLRPSFVLLAFGCRDWQQAEPWGSPAAVARFESALTEAVRRARALGAIPVLATIGPLDTHRYQTAHPRARAEGAQEDVQEVRDAYNAAIRRVARNMETPLADVSLAAWGNEPDWLAPTDAPDTPGSTLTPAAVQRVAALFGRAMAATAGPWR
ncbi:MAG: hypothetical protein GX774_19895 [Armatimonadetes bacterium]|nr:hypothetical protein [Armatimonadota bacterium]